MSESMPPMSQRKRIEFEDDIVKVYDGNKEIYAGAEDYEPMQDEDWKWDNANKYYKFDKYIKVCCESSQKNEGPEEFKDNKYERDFFEYKNGGHGSFMEYLAKACMQADKKNLTKIQKEFPELTKAFCLWKSSGRADKAEKL